MAYLQSILYSVRVLVYCSEYGVQSPRNALGFHVSPLYDVMPCGSMSIWIHTPSSVPECNILFHLPRRAGLSVHDVDLTRVYFPWKARSSGIKPTCLSSYIIFCKSYIYIVPHMENKTLLLQHGISRDYKSEISLQRGSRTSRWFTGQFGIYADAERLAVWQWVSGDIFLFVHWSR